MPADLVGRTADVDALVALAGTAERSSAPAVGLVTGPPGVGKTRLLTEVRARGLLPGALRVCGFEAESGIPLAAVRELLERVAAGPGGTLVERFLTGAGAAGDLMHLFEAAARAVRSRPSPYVVVDDLQWVDRTSVALLHYVVRAAETGRSPLVLVAAGRDGPVFDRLGRSLAGVLGDPRRLLRVDLGPLDGEQSAVLARALAPGLGSAALVGIVHRTEGIPFWIEVLAGEGTGRGAAGALDRRLRAATGDAAVLLSLLAVLGRPLERSSVAEVLRWPEARVDASAEDLLAAGLVRDDGTALTVGHPILGEQVLGRLDPGTAERLHRVLAGWLADRATDQAGLVEAVERGRRAGLPMPDAALRLASSPQRRLLGLPGLALLREVVAASDPGTTTGARLERAVTRLAAELGDHEAGLAGWSAVLERTADPSLATEAALGAAECAQHLDRAAEAERFLARVPRSSAADPLAEAEVAARSSGVLLWLRHRGDEGRAAGARAVRAARLLADRAGGADRLSPRERQAYVRALLAGAEAAIHADRPADVLALTDEIAAWAGADGERTRVRALTEGALALRWLGRNADAEARLRLTWDEVRREALPQATVEVGALLAKVLHSRGRLAEAGEVLADCDAVGQRLAEFCPSRAFTPLIGHLLSASRGDWRRAVAGLRVEARAEDDPHYRAHVRLEGALLLARYGSRRLATDVRPDVALALSESAGSGCLRCSREVRARGAETLARIGDVPAARRLLDAWDAAPEDGDRAVRFWVGQARAAVLSAEDAPDAAEAWRATVGEADDCGYLLEALWARIDLGTVLARSDRPAAADVLREAGETAQRWGAVTEVQSVEQVLRGLGVRTWRRPAGAVPGAVVPAGLTEREREIASRVASGASNGEIAAALFLSRKTVERHVSNVLARCGWRNRAELAAAWSAEPARPEPEGVHR